MEGTFYVPVNALEGKEVRTLDQNENFLSKEQLRDINEDFEIGGHGVAHYFLTDVTEGVARKEIKESKEYLEDLLNEEIAGFAYPGGHFNDRVVEIVERSGYSYARTVGNGSLEFSERYKVPVTIFCYNNLVRRLKFSLFAPFSGVYAFGGDWAKSVLKSFETLKEEGGVLHIAEHPKRLRSSRFRKKLEEVFSRISGHSDIEYLTNGETVERVLGES